VDPEIRTWAVAYGATDTFGGDFVVLVNLDCIKQSKTGRKFKIDDFPQFYQGTNSSLQALQ
jgi:hypothetical protein